MKNKNFILGIMIGAIGMFILNVTASYLYNAKDIAYNDTNVESAISDLKTFNDETKVNLESQINSIQEQNSNLQSQITNGKQSIANALNNKGNSFTSNNSFGDYVTAINKLKRVQVAGSVACNSSDSGNSCSMSVASGQIYVCYSNLRYKEYSRTNNSYNISGGNLIWHMYDGSYLDYRYAAVHFIIMATSSTITISLGNTSGMNGYCVLLS